VFAAPQEIANRTGLTDGNIKGQLCGQITSGLDN
jgi:hypothetical protein